MWDAQTEELKLTNRVITYDVRGHGDTDEGDEDFSIALFVEDLIGLMDELKIDSAILCGLSMGGYIALQAIEKYPERFNGLVLSDTTCKADTPEGKEKRMMTIESIKKNGVEKFVEGMIKNLFAEKSFITKKPAIHAVKEMMLKTSQSALCKTLLALAGRAETCNRLPEINVPVLIMAGYEDKITPPATARFLHEKIKSSRLHILNHAGHVANIENPEDFNEQLKMFIQYAAAKATATVH
jgi:pimeloyl-ACP methyl ester carboxylesterase